jgi:hypothetical protein
MRKNQSSENTCVCANAGGIGVDGGGGNRTFCFLFSSARCGKPRKKKIVMQYFSTVYCCGASDGTEDFFGF